MGVSCYSSSDLVRWKNEGIALKMMQDRSFSDIVKGYVIERPKVMNVARFRQNDIISGGSLVFEMGSKPNYNWDNGSLIE